jgi:hypothetical protein
MKKELEETKDQQQAEALSSEDYATQGYNAKEKGTGMHKSGCRRTDIYKKC